MASPVRIRLLLQKLTTKIYESYFSLNIITCYPLICTVSRQWPADFGRVNTSSPKQDQHQNFSANHCSVFKYKKKKVLQNFYAEPRLKCSHTQFICLAPLDRNRKPKFRISTAAILLYSLENKIRSSGLHSHVVFGRFWVQISTQRLNLFLP